MAITLGSETLDETHTSVEERLEEVGGRDERRITVSGLIFGLSDRDSVEGALDAIIDAASAEDYSTALVLRTGRRLWVRRDRYERAIDGERIAGSFELRLLAKSPFEESVSESSAVWNVAASGAAQAVSPAGNAMTFPRFTLVASGTIVNPTISDGTRSITYSGTVGDGETLILDGSNRTATLEGTDVLPYTDGVFPSAAPEGTTFTYTDDVTSSHTCAITIAYRDRWW